MTSDLKSLLPYLTEQERDEMDFLLMASPLDSLRDDPTLTMSLSGLTPDAWQSRVLTATWADRLLLLCSRQAGKSTTTAAVAVHQALTVPDSLVLILSPSERQSGELAQKVFGYYDALGKPVPSRKRTELQLYLSNGSRVIALPDNEKTIRCFSGVKLLVIDEASRVDDALYHTVRPMLAVSHGRLIALSTPFGQRGWFFDEWQSQRKWQRERITAAECARISPEFLAEEKASMGERWFKQEYFCSFESAVDQVFSPEAIQRAMRPDVAPLWGM